MATRKIDCRRLAMLKLILMDERIFESLSVDGNKAKKFIVNENGDVMIGKYKYGWVNHLFNSYYTISFFEVASRISLIITGGKGNCCDNDGLVGFIHETIDKVLKKDEREKVIELLLHYSTLISDDSPLKLKYDINKDDPNLQRNTGTNRYRHMVGRGDAVLDLGSERIPISIVIDGTV